LRLSVLNEMHTNSYTGPRLLSLFCENYRFSETEKYMDAWKYLETES
jgi:hypothetical protein